MNWLTVVVVALILGAIVDIWDRGRKKSAFALALLFALAVGAAYSFFLYLGLLN